MVTENTVYTLKTFEVERIFLWAFVLVLQIFGMSQLPVCWNCISFPLALPLRALRVLISKMSSGKRQFFCYIFPAFLAFLHGTMMNCQSLIDCKAWPWHFLLSWVCSSVLSRQAQSTVGEALYIFSCWLERVGVAKTLKFDLRLVPTVRNGTHVYCQKTGIVSKRVQTFKM